MKIILRVDDCGWTPDPDNRRDVGLAYFQKWRAAFGIAKDPRPIYYGFIPAELSKDELNWLRTTLKPSEMIAAHGYLHNEGELFDEWCLCHAVGVLSKARHDSYTFIPPFNKYTARTITNWDNIWRDRQNYFLGGFHGQHHGLGHYPTLHGNCLHIPACEDLYARAYQILDRKVLNWYADCQCPLVLTLHCTWDANYMDALPKLYDKIKDHLITVGDALDWYNSAQLRLDKLSAPHYVAYDFICRHLQPRNVVFDFGSRYSDLPALMALRCRRVCAYDTDERVQEHAVKAGAEYGVKYTTVVGKRFVSEATYLNDDFDTITSCWAIQHNLILDQLEIIKAMAGMLNEGGQLLIVSSYTPGETFYQGGREDPQTVLSLKDHDRLIAHSGLKLTERMFFRYDHGTTHYDITDHKSANAVCYRLEK